MAPASSLRKSRDRDAKARALCKGVSPGLSVSRRCLKFRIEFRGCFWIAFAIVSVLTVIAVEKGSPHGEVWN
jgi:hypothetical protein